MACEPGVRQIPVSTYAAPCVAAFSGDNGGATYRGVTADEIVIVERTFPESANSQAVDAISEQAGAASDNVDQVVFDTFKEYFNSHFELYGRSVRWVTYESQFGNSTTEAQSKGREEACLDADVVANEIGAFGVIGTRGGAVSSPFAECAAQRGLVVFNGASYFPERFFAERHPFVWSVAMECERIAYQVAEYLGKRLAGKPARFAGDPALASQTRAFGTSVPNNDGYQACVDITERVGEEQHGYSSTSRYNYTLDVSRFPDEANRAVVQFKADGVTTVVLASDPISVVFLTQAATSQDYYPEWFLIGTALQDTDNMGQLYDQQQVDGHMFGMSQLGSTAKVVGPSSEPGRLYELITGEQIPDGTSGGYAGLHMVFNLLQAAGPNLTPDAIAAGARSLPPGGAPDYPFGYWSLADGPQGTPGAGDHTAVDDSREIYWTRDFVSPVTGSPGTFMETYDGRRFRNGEWPAEDPPVYPGS
ncbi:MAG: ABC transporter substrate-binding protein [Actinomycetota bacterium]|nr:ABC transporter substrate-binding protein [Actinomycetota bacterium]